MIRKIAYFIAAFGIVFSLTSPNVAFAADKLFGGACSNAAAKDSAICQGTQTTNPLTGSNGLIVKITRLIAYVAGAAAVIIIMLSGFRYINSSGDATKATQARNGIIYALVGLIVIISAQYIISLVMRKI